MKKCAASALAATLVLSLTACNFNVNLDNGGKDNNISASNIESGEENNNGSGEGGSTATNPDGNTDTEQGTNGGTAGPKYENYPKYSLYDNELQVDYEQDSDGENYEVARTAYTRIYINNYEDESYKELAEKLDTYYSDKEAELKETHKGFLQEIETMKEEGMEGGFPMEYEIDHAGVIRADKQVFSIMEDQEVYYGGAHGGNGLAGINLNSQTGEEIELSDVITDMDGLASVITDVLYMDYDPEIFFAEDKDELQETVQDYLDKGLGWNITYDGVCFYFGDYALAAYASGHQVAFINYDTYPEYLNAEYFENADKEYVMKVWHDVYYPIHSDTFGPTFAGFDWTKDYNEESGYYSETYRNLIIFGHFYQELDLEGSISDPGVYIIHRNGRDFLYVDNCYFDGVEMLQTFEMKDGAFEPAYTLDGGIYIESNDLKDSYSYSADGSFTYNFAFSEGTLSVGENGEPVLGDKFEFYRAENWEEYYDAKADIKAKGVDANGEPTNDDITLKKGTSVQLVCSDRSTYIIVEDKNGVQYYISIKYVNDDYQIKNKPSIDWFEYKSNW